MPLDELRKAVEGHAGIFHCRGRGDPSRVKDVAFHHEFGEPPATGVDLPLRSLTDFYGTFAWLRLYRDPDSDDSAFYIGTPEEWAGFDEALRCWFEDLTPGERSGLLPPLDRRLPGHRRDPQVGQLPAGAAVGTPEGPRRRV